MKNGKPRKGRQIIDGDVNPRCETTMGNHREKRVIMRYFVLLILVLMMAGCQEKYSDKVIAAYENGQPKIVQQVDKKGMSVGETHYYEDGSLMMKGPLKDGVRTGEWTSYFPDGKVQSTGFFVNGKRTGPSKVYWSSGNLFMVGDYKDGHRVGKWIYYDEQGYLDKEVDFGDGE